MEVEPSVSGGVKSLIFAGKKALSEDNCLKKMYLPHPYRKVLLFVLVTVLAVVVNLLLYGAMDPTGNRDLSYTYGLVAFILVKLCFLIAYVGFVIQGSRVHWGWGCVIFLLPVSALFFLVSHPKPAKIPSLIFLAGVLVLILLIIGAVVSGHWGLKLSL
jgi:hypothetical protein